MKYTYEYRTSDNARHTGVVDAVDREAAFQQLKSQGIKPGRLTEAPGFFNHLFGKGKRWLTIGVLSALCLVLCAIALHYSHEARSTEHEARYAAEDRAQLFGDLAVIQKLARNGWRETFPDEGEAFLARHAIPGKVCDCAEKVNEKVKGEGQGQQWNVIASALMARKDTPIAMDEADSEELKKMKRMVNGMKREFADFVAPDPAQPPTPNPQPSTLNTQPASPCSSCSPWLKSALDYMSRCCERCRIEKGVYDGFARELAALERQLEDPKADRTKILADWDKKNAALRAMGLDTIPQPE